MTSLDNRIAYLLELLTDCYYEDHAKPWREELQTLIARRDALMGNKQNG